MANLDASLTAVLNRFVTIMLNNGQTMTGILTDVTGDCVTLNNLISRATLDATDTAAKAAFIANLSKTIIPKTAIVALPHVDSTTATPA